MTRIGRCIAVAATAALALLGAGSALADDCALLGGVIVNVPPNECQVSAPTNVPARAAPYVLDETLHILGTGSIVVVPNGPPNDGITIQINAGDLLMDTGALIDGNVATCDFGSNITVNVLNGDIVMAPGSIIRSNSCSGGTIVLTTTAAHTADIDGTVESVGSLSGTGGAQRPGGGPIRIVAGCTLNISDTGLVSSRGRDPGADLVHLEGCTVTIFGRVESTAPGHVNPINPANHCNLDPLAHPPGTSQFYTGCVEIWAGTTILVDSTGTHKGEINADIGITGGPQGRGWIDMYANGNINIVDGTGNDHTYTFGGGCSYLSTFAVHSNGGLCQNTDDGGYITIKSLAGDVVATGHAIQADAISAGSKGGEVHVEAAQNVSFNDGVLFARGDFVATGGFGFGGKLGTNVAPIRAYNGALSWTSGEGNVLPTGNLGTLPAANRGVIFLEGCTAVNLGASFPFLGAAATTPTVLGPACGGAPTKATSGSLPTATCLTSCQLTQSKKGTKFFDTNNNHMRDGGEPGLPNWTINAYDGAVLFTSALTDASGNYSLPLTAGVTYTVCEVQQAGWTQTCPQLGVAPNGTGCNGLPATNLADCSALTGQPGNVGYTVTLQSGVDETGNDFGNFRSSTTCEKQPVQDVLNPVTGRFPGNLGADINVILSNGDLIQDAVDQLAAQGDLNGDGYLIITVQKDGTGQLGGHTNQRVEISAQYTLPFALIGCSVTMHTPDASVPTGLITLNASAPQPTDQFGKTELGNIFVMDLHGADSSIAGWYVLGNGRYLRNVGTGGNGIGVVFWGNSNLMHNGSGSGNGIGMYILGNSNKVDSTDIFANSSIGIYVEGNGNTILKADVGEKGKGNGTDGVVVKGGNNLIQEVDAYANGGNGFVLVSGTGNRFLKNRAGDRGKGNGGAGFLLNGGSTLTENKAIANSGDGFHLQSSGFSLSKNVSGGTGSGYANGGCQFRFDVAGNGNAGGNTSNGVTLVGNPLPAGCF